MAAEASVMATEASLMAEAPEVAGEASLVAGAVVLVTAVVHSFDPIGPELWTARCAVGGRGAPSWAWTH